MMNAGWYNMVVRHAMAELDTVFRDILSAMIEQGKADGHIRSDLPTTAVAVLLVGMLRGIGVQSRVHPGAVDIEACRDGVHLLVHAALRA